MKDAQRFERNEAEKADAVLHAAVNHGAAHVGMARDFVADDDEPQIAIAAVIFSSLRATAKASIRRGMFFCGRMEPA